MTGDETLMPLRLIQWVRDEKGSRIGTVGIVLGKSLKMLDLPVKRNALGRHAITTAD